MAQTSKLVLGLIAVFALGLFFRFYKLTSYPVSLTIDEVEIGYNAYSLLKTGHDTWKQAFPLAFKSVGDYKPPVNFYLTVPSIAILGLNEFSTRFPTAFLGALSCAMLVIFLRKIRMPLNASLFGGLWLAVLPWHVHFSRAGFEAITSLFFLITAVPLFFSSLKKRSHLSLALSVVCFSLSVWAYHSSRLFVPLLVIFLTIKYRQQLQFVFNCLRKLSTIIAIFLFFSVPFVVLSFFTPAVLSRIASTSILREAGLSKTLHNGTYDIYSEWIFDNDLYLIFHHWSGKYTDYFNLRYWFWKGLSFTPPGYLDTGLLYLIDAPLLLIGIYSAFKKRYQFSALAFFWFLLGPLPASITMNDQHPLRALVWIPAFAIFVSLGYSKLVTSKKRLLVYTVILIANMFFVTDLYFNQLPRYFSEFWHYGFKQIAQYACARQNQYQDIIISETFGSEGPLLSGIPYTYVLFYCKKDPATYQRTRNIDNFIFRRIDWPHDKNRPNALLISAPWDYVSTGVPTDKIIKEIPFLNGKPGFIFVQTRQKTDNNK
jgi:hypothetical protein